MTTKLSSIKDSVVTKHSIKFLIVILLISAFFRFYNLLNFQYWSGDEEIASALVRRMIVNKQIALISPNSNLSSSLGSYFHLASVPLFLIANLNPVIVLSVIPLLGVITTYVMYLVGKTLEDKKLGLVSSFLYASSFLATLFDKRWWPLTLNCFLTAISLLALFKIIKEKKYYYSVFLAIAAGFAGHADPSLAVIAISALIVFLLFKINIFRKEFIPAVIVFSLFLLPLIVFEVRHPGTITAPFLKSISTTSQTSIAPEQSFNATNLALSTFTRLFATRPSNFAENQFCYCATYELPLFNNISKTTILLLIIYPLVLILKKKDFKNLMLIPYSFLLVFFISTQIFESSFKLPIHQHYFTVVFPVVFLIVAYSITKLFKNNILLTAILFVVLALNLFTFLNSSFKYPLLQKQKIVADLSKSISGDFSFYVAGDAWFHGGGFTELFILNNKHPKKSYIYYFYDWMYKAHSLYTVTPTDVDQEKIIVIGATGKIPNTNLKVLFSENVGNMEGKIFDNSNFTFDPKTLNSL